MPASGLVIDDAGTSRCLWCAQDVLYQRYHDTEWGFPQADDQRLFEKLCLEGFQAGLSWLTILRKRENFRRGFADFDPDRVARFTPAKVEGLLADSGIVRHRGKIESAINNARQLRRLREERGSLAAYLWSFEPPARARPRRVTYGWLMRNPTTPESIALSKDLRRRGFSFVGPTTMYALMQSMGLCNDHIEGCHTRELAAAARRRFTPPE